MEHLHLPNDQQYWRGLIIEYRIHSDDGPGLKNTCSVEWDVVGIAGDGSEFAQWVLEWPWDRLPDFENVRAYATQGIAETYALEFSDELERELIGHE
jgi:hypothetical protein